MIEVNLEQLLKECKERKELLESQGHKPSMEYMVTYAMKNVQKHFSLMMHMNSEFMNEVEKGLSPAKEKKAPGKGKTSKK